MAGFFIMILVLLAAVYIYSLSKIKKNRKKLNEMNTIQDIHDSYRRFSGKTKPQEKNHSDGYQYYITKYNSSEDYREKNN